MRLLIPILLASCSFGVQTEDSLHREAKTRYCTPDQIKLAKADFDLCKESGYSNSHCYDLAKITYCGKKKEN